MPYTRRSFLTASAIAAAALCSTRSAAGLLGSAGRPARVTRRAADTYFEWKKVAESCHVASGEGGNTLAVLAGERSLLVDSKNGGFGPVLRREAAALGAPVAMLINTHHHFDHTGGNPAFTGDVEVVAHVNAAARIASGFEMSMGAARRSIQQLRQSGRPGAGRVVADIEEWLRSGPTEKDFHPTRFIPSSGSLSVGSLTIEVHHTGAGHTDNDLIVRLPEHNVVHAGDLLFNACWPYLDPTNSGADTAGWIRACRKIVELCDERTVVIPGHGEVGDVEIAQRQIGLLSRVREEAARAVEKGVARDEFLKTPFPEYEQFGLPTIRPFTLGGAWDEASRDAGK
ncbi:MAG: MBL fold metallo-hydrolase [Phycisphaeraceae bacterium]|nr:MBL fold metallo-hydrolase [Phycisphaeraceae bacterium]